MDWAARYFALGCCFVIDGGELLAVCGVLVPAFESVGHHQRTRGCVGRDEIPTGSPVASGAEKTGAAGAAASWRRAAYADARPGAADPVGACRRRWTSPPCPASASRTAPHAFAFACNVICGF